MSAPTEAEIRAAVEARYDNPDDGYARDTDWIAYLSDGLRHGVWQCARDSHGDLMDEDPELRRLADEAEDRIARLCKAIALEEFTAAGLEFARRHPA